MTVMTVTPEPTDPIAPPGADALQFVRPLPGFSDETAYTLQAIDDHGVLFSMRSVGEPQVRFVLAPSDRFFDDYTPHIDDEVTRALGLVDGDEVTLMLMLTIADGLDDATANLRAPVVVANSSGRALQVILEDDSLPMRRPLVS